jgi:1-acyl-sn-glycerol-3-phosphate acyltransferase
MPLPPLSEPTSAARRLRALAIAIPIAIFLFGTLILFNLLQTLSVAVRPFSATAFRRFNRWAANTWWGWCVIASERLHGIRIVVTGDDIPAAENAIVVANHQQMPDITFLMIWARQKQRLGDMKWLVKDLIKWVPGVGWGMAFLDCVFVKRNWARDRASIEHAFSRLKRHRVPLWLLSFPEGTRLTPAKLAQSRAHAEREGLPPPEQVLVPRTKGFVAAVSGLADHVAAVYDVTIGYVQGVPTLWQYIKGYARVAHLHVRRSPLSSLPTSEAALAQWLLRRFQEKDRLLQYFYRHGAFPAAAGGDAELEALA